MRRAAVSTKSIFQCYAPDTMKELELIAKVDKDFHGARAHWAAEMAKSIFVHNDGRGLPPKRFTYRRLTEGTCADRNRNLVGARLLKLAMELDSPPFRRFRLRRLDRYRRPAGHDRSHTDHRRVARQDPNSPIRR